MVRVVGRERVERRAALERLVPVERRVAAADLELAARVPDLEPAESAACLPLLRAQAAPVGARYGTPPFSTIQATTSGSGAKPSPGATGSA